MQQHNFDWLALQAGWAGQVRDVMELQEVHAWGIPQIAARLGLTPEQVLSYIVQAETLYRASREEEGRPPSRLDAARELLGLLGNRRRIHTHRTRGPGRTGRDGLGDLGREVVPAMVERSPWPSAWDLVPTPKDNPLAARSRREHAARLVRERQAERLNRELRRTGETGRRLNRAQRRQLGRWGRKRGGA